jgi:hypothetical protein
MGARENLFDLSGLKPKFDPGVFRTCVIHMTTCSHLRRTYLPYISKDVVVLYESLPGAKERL